MEKQLNHLISIGRKYFAIATERGATVVTGDANTIRQYIAEHDTTSLYLHTQ